MKTRQFITLLVLSGISFLVTGCQDHFKVYRVTASEASHAVELKGQFDRQGAHPARLGRVTHFANPVKKNKHKIFHPNYHLTWYELEQRSQEPDRDVSLNNQFGDQTWGIGTPKYLAVPTQKIEQGGKFPSGLDHYKCYEVIDVRQSHKHEDPLTLEDQWTTQRVALGKPRFFCVPVEKTYQDETTPIQLSAWHLAVYDITTETWKQDTEVVDQFGRKTLHVEESAWLCVPTTKRSWSVRH